MQILKQENSLLHNLQRVDSIYDATQHSDVLLNSLASFLLWRVAMERDAELIFDLTFGRWRSQILHAGVALCIFDYVSENKPTSIDEIAKETNCDEKLLYRLLRV